MPETPAEAVVQFGPDDDAAPERTRFRPGAHLAGLAADRRVVPLAAVLGGVALFGSLVSEWQVTNVDAAFWGDGEVSARPLETTVADLDGWAGGYLTGLLLLVPAVVLTLFGPAAGRRYTRLTALSIGGVLLGMLAAVSSHLGDTSRILGQIGATNLGEDQVTISHGRGIWCAAVGVALTLLSMYLAGRDSGAGPQSPEEAPEPPPVWSWRRPAPDAEDGPPDAPIGLTVTPAKPFTPTQDNRDKPS
ncbi:hypothetical protein ACIBSW_36160 [Actinoplanes sp. NPDC049668]|uniref:hypothetical protein n=1 Tax=unclassified Actinoplanes TaxID=2626549 RepID=UPI0033B4E464